MNDLFELRISTQPHSEVYCGYIRRLVCGNSLTFSHIPPCFHAKTPNFPRDYYACIDRVDNKYGILVGIVKITVFA